MSEAIQSIAIVQGAASDAVQRLLSDFAERWKPALRLAGMIEEPQDDTRARLRSIVDGRLYELFQQLGSGSGGCGLDAEGVISAAAAVERDIAAGCDLLILSKFGKLEAENRSGLLSAFVTGIAAGVPILTAVSPRCTEAWTRFAAPMFVILPSDAAAIEAWWQGIRAAGAGAQPLVAKPG